jgi:hypothetical protein
VILLQKIIIACPCTTINFAIFRPNFLISRERILCSIKCQNMQSNHLKYALESLKYAPICTKSKISKYIELPKTRIFKVFSGILSGMNKNSICSYFQQKLQEWSICSTFYFQYEHTV